MAIRYKSIDKNNHKVDYYSYLRIRIKKVYHMKHILFMAAFVALFTSCSKQEAVEISIFNPIAQARSEEMVEIQASEIYEKLGLTDTSSFVVYNEKAEEVPYQLTYDNKIIFPVEVAEGATVKYTVQEGMPATVAAMVYGRQYPERLDDMTWENDRAAYRAYGPALQTLGEKAYGYDVFTKRGTKELVVEERYAKELHPVLRPKVQQLKKEGKMKEAKAIEATISYHIDQGNGMDAYAVGPTLGGGAAALYVDNELVYPYCYKDYEILDNGPLRFTVKLVFTPLAVKDNADVIETRIIQLDAGSHLNKTTIRYSALAEKTPIAAGLVIHAAHPDRYTLDAPAGYIAYADPSTNVNANNGIIYVGVVFPNVMQEAKAEMFKAPHGDAIGHVLAVGEYNPESDFVYYWGSGWSKAGFADDNSWNEYLKKYAGCVRNPLKITIQ